MSRTPEGRIKDYLKKRVEALGGEVRFVKYSGRRNCPDVRVRFPNGERGYDVFGSHWHRVFNCWVETKGKDGKLSSGQEREIQHMRDFGETVLVLLTKEDIDREFPL